jgi:hypothetical protein
VRVAQPWTLRYYALMKGEDDTLENTVIQFVPAKDYNRDMEAQFNALANAGGQTVVLPRELSRKRVAQAFSDAFELIGGVSRLAEWADKNETDFYKLYAKLMPTAASGDMSETNERVIRHVLPPTELDQ